MKRYLRGKTALAGLAIAGGAALAAVGSAAPALGFFSPPLTLQLHIASPAALVAKGAGVDVPVQVQCAGAKTASLNISLTERAGSLIASGNASTQIACTDQTVTVLVTAAPGKAFKKGTAIANGDLSACTPRNRVCGSQTDQETISISH